jgi:hypothetical protein
MEINIYKTYNFDFDTDIYTKEFKKALDNSGVKKPAQFNQLIKDAGIKDYDYETVKSYFYGRRVPPLNIFIAVCKSLHLCADEIVFPQSIQKPLFNKDICDCEYLFRNIFYPYNKSEDDNIPTDYTEFFDAETYESNVDDLALILSRYNYLIQKYHYASVSNDELMQISFFTQRYIIDREKNDITDSENVMEWIRSSDDEEFFKAFYDKYTLGFYCMSCHSLLDVLGTAIQSKFIRYAQRLLPHQDMLKGGRYENV